MQQIPSPRSVQAGKVIQGQWTPTAVTINGSRVSCLSQRHEAAAGDHRLDNPPRPLLALALVVPVLWLVAWILSIPLRAVAIVLGGLLALLRALAFLPARLLGH
jgi:Flp pilus assembly protein TadB